jgi:predicted PurR-regulated permease PerM
VGSPLGWVPACAYLLLQGRAGPAVGLLVFCTVVVSGSDNVIKPLVLRGSARIHPLLGFLSIVGGVLAFGVFGFLIGPVVLSLVLSAIRIYRLDVLRVAVTGVSSEAGPAEDRSTVESAP